MDNSTVLAGEAMCDIYQNKPKPSGIPWDSKIGTSSERFSLRFSSDGVCCSSSSETDLKSIVSVVTE